MSTFKLKIIAVVTMLIDHIGAIIPEAFGLPPTGVNFLRVIGRLAFPIFVFLIAEGFHHTKSPGKFLVRLAIFALISEIPFDLALNSRIDFFAHTNIFYTLLLGGVAITLHKKMESSPLRLSPLLTLALMFLAEVLSADYGAAGVAFIFAMYVAKNNSRLRFFLMAFFCVWLNIPALLQIYPFVSLIHFLMIPATLLAVPLCISYNEKRGMDVKWFFYAFYPVHLLILAML
jgi:hypothetical protein